MNNGCLHCGMQSPQNCADCEDRPSGGGRSIVSLDALRDAGHDIAAPVVDGPCERESAERDAVAAAMAAFFSLPHHQQRIVGLRFIDCRTHPHSFAAIARERGVSKQYIAREFEDALTTWRPLKALFERAGKPTKCEEVDE